MDMAAARTRRQAGVENQRFNIERGVCNPYLGEEDRDNRPRVLSSGHLAILAMTSLGGELWKMEFDSLEAEGKPGT